ncbi:GGDEF domain-containing protein [Ornithinibacillus halophilus]|uniref:Diguanylate cyclase (GGDEF) domain-containing protein n=1 Tax=Ornithinibacillus halophilus TaxID=930117 RepID=A0A1M5GQ20_9BACI|nr:GGDEF domain-containing protein [Ornithinibacillus halophilus]SHG05747.1 diguanylate cyclase (GGDEF) domain-containing protein [Ornithinibacillus halophilus]
MGYTGRITILILITTTTVTNFIIADNIEPLAIVFSLIFVALSWFIGGFYDKYHFLSYHDSLTKVFNRRYGYIFIPKMLSQAKRKNTSIALLTIDIDQFKTINDTYGHQAGDAILYKVSQLLQTKIRKTDRIIRWGGDEFLLICQNMNRADAIGMKNRLQDSLNGTILEKNITIQLSIGIAIYPEDGESLDTLITFSDEKMYESKAKNKQHNNELLQQEDILDKGDYR